MHSFPALMDEEGEGKGGFTGACAGHVWLRQHTLSACARQVLLPRLVCMHASWGCLMQNTDPQMRSIYMEERIPERKQRFAEAGFIHGRLGVSWLCCTGPRPWQQPCCDAYNLTAQGCSVGPSGMSCNSRKVFSQPCCALHAKHPQLCCLHQLSAAHEACVCRRLMGSSPTRRLPTR